MWKLGLIATILIGGLLQSQALSQTVRNTDYSPDKTLQSNARVNPSTLAMELSIPISGYVGRGGNGLPLSFNYSSKVWDMKHGANLNDPILGTKTQVHPNFAKRTAAGWTSSLGTARIDYKFDWYRDSDPGQGTPYQGSMYSPAIWEEDLSVSIYYIKRVHVQLPDGSSHEFRSSDLPILCGNIDSPSCHQPNLMGIYLSVDGSRMRLETGQNSSTLYLPDGSHYIFGTFPGSGRDEVPPSFAHTFIDRDGNKMTYDIGNREWTDTMGRVLSDPFPANWYTQTQTEGTQLKTFPAIDNSDIEYEFTWSHLKDPDGSNHALDNTSLDPYNLSNLYCQGGTEHNTIGNYLFGQNDPYTRICGSGYATQGPPFNPVVLAKIELPNGQSYQFKYNVYGEVVRIIYPSGGYERFAYHQLWPLQTGSLAHDRANRGVSDRWISESGSGNDEVHWTYDLSTGYQQPYIVTVTEPDGTYTQQYLHDEPFDTSRPFGFSNALTGRSYEDRSYSPSDVLMRRTLHEFEETSVAIGINTPYTLTATRDMRPVKDISITFESGESNALATLTETVYDTTGNNDPAYFSSLNPKQVKTYGYVVVNASTAASANFATALAWFNGKTPVNTVETDYLYDANYKARNINGLVTETRIKDAAGNVKAKTQFVYDEVGSYPIISAGTHSQWTDPGTNYRGNVTTTKSWHDIANNQYVQTHAQYDNFGNLRKTWDANGNLTQTDYSSTYAYAYPTSVTTAVPDPTGTHGSNAAFTTSTTYDYNTGLPLTTTDANGAVTTMEYNDPLLRPTKVTAPNGQQTITEYGAGTSEATRWVKVKSQIDDTKWKEGLSWFDGLGRTVRTQSVDTESGDVFALTCYDNMGRIAKTSNPFRGYSSQTCATANGSVTDGQPANGSNQIFWTTNTFDAAGRPWKVTTPDGAVVETAYSLSSAGTVGTAVTVTDQAGKQRRSITNALGQLIRVDEPNNAGQLGSLASPNQATSYSY